MCPQGKQARSYCLQEVRGYTRDAPGHLGSDPVGPSGLSQRLQASKRRSLEAFAPAGLWTTFEWCMGPVAPSLLNASERRLVILLRSFRNLAVEQQVLHVPLLWSASGRRPDMEEFFAPSPLAQHLPGPPTVLARHGTQSCSELSEGPQPLRLFCAPFAGSLLPMGDGQSRLDARCCLGVLTYVLGEVFWSLLAGTGRCQLVPLNACLLLYVYAGTGRGVSDGLWV